VTSKAYQSKTVARSVTKKSQHIHAKGNVEDSIDTCSRPESRAEEYPRLINPFSNIPTWTGSEFKVEQEWIDDSRNSGSASETDPRPESTVVSSRRPPLVSRP
jgi:hypothetical protein